MNGEIRTLDLFSGIGGFSLGLERAGPFRTVAFCEQEPYAQRVLKKHWPDTPIYDDVRTIPTNGLGKIDLICGGFPCQPWSTAGEQRGAEDDRDLWPAMVALIEDLRPQWVIGENVRGFVSQPMGLQRSLSDLARIGFEAVPFIIPACAVDAPHRRDRVWIVAYRKDGIGAGVAGALAGAEREIQAGRKQFQPRLKPRGGGANTRGNQWLPEPDMGRVAHGVPNRVDRLRCLGNAVVPQVVEQIGKAILEGWQR